jgi:hypothetical protein
MAMGEAEVVEPRRVRNFASFFKNYMSISAVVTASLPIPLTAAGAIPTFRAQTMYLTTYASLFCFLLLAFVFYSRHRLARWMFPKQFAAPTLRSSLLAFAVASLPMLFIFGAVSSAFRYHIVLNEALTVTEAGMTLEAARAANAPGADAALNKIRTSQYTVGLAGPLEGPGETARLALTEYSSFRPSPGTDFLAALNTHRIPFAHALMALYLGIFLLAEAAFVLMALREYLQDLLKIEELDIVKPTLLDTTDNEALQRTGSAGR